MKEIIPTDDDVRYFRDKIARMKERGASEESLARTKKQLALIEDCEIIYKLVNECRT